MAFQRIKFGCEENACLGHRALFVNYSAAIFRIRISDGRNMYFIPAIPYAYNVRLQNSSRYVSVQKIFTATCTSKFRVEVPKRLSTRPKRLRALLSFVQIQQFSLTDVHIHVGYFTTQTRMARPASLPRMWCRTDVDGFEVWKAGNTCAFRKSGGVASPL